MTVIKDRFSINVVQNDEGEILLLKRSQLAEIGPGLWGFPAGHIRQGESPSDCAQRELQEEIGKDFQARLVDEFGPVRDNHYGGVYEIFLFHHLWLGGNINLNCEHTAYAWAGPDDFCRYEIMAGMKDDLDYLGIWRNP